MHLAAGLSVGLAGVAAGYTIGIVGDAVWPYMSGIHSFACLTDLLGCACLHATIPGLRRDDPYLDFWRGSWSLRVCHHLKMRWFPSANRI